MTRNYREAYQLHASNGILFNHESPRRGYEFVTRKISSGVARIRAGRAKELRLGNLDAKRDWGHAREYVKAMWQMLQQPEPDDYVVATGETHSVREFAELAFSVAGLDSLDYVVTDPTLHRPAEVTLLLGDAAKAREKLGWSYSIRFGDLVREMVESDCRALGVPLASRYLLPSSERRPEWLKTSLMRRWDNSGAGCTGWGCPAPTGREWKSSTRLSTPA